MELVETLHDLEKKVLLSLKDIGEGVTVNIIVDESDLKRGEVNKAIQWLKEKNIIKLDESSKELFVTTKLGREYIEEGLPEHKFLKAISKKKLPIKDVIKKAGLSKNEFNIAMGLLVNQGLAEMDKGILEITEDGKKKLEGDWREEKLLVFLKDKKYFDEIKPNMQAFVGSLTDRNLIERDIDKVRQVRLTKLGKEILPKVKIEDTIDMVTPQIIQNKTWKKTKFRKYDINSPVPRRDLGKKQPYLAFLDDLRRKMVGMGFKEMSGPNVELNFMNDVLYMPQDHPARAIHDIFYLKDPAKGSLKDYSKELKNVAKTHENGWKTGSSGWGYNYDKEKAKRLVLRSQTTNVSARKMLSKDLEIPGKYFTIDRNYRVDVIDWKHLIEFDQLEGIVLGNEVDFKQLLGMLKMFAEEVGGAKKIKFVPGYFPFTEPSVELHIWQEGKGWVEIGGAGIFRPEVTEPLGIDVPVIAWGMGIFRLYMNKYNIKDMRQIFSNDLKWLREFK